MTWRIRNVDPDAQAYILAVQRADGQSLEADVQFAINRFVMGCKQDGIWNAIKASCIMAGARTLNGALVPLVGPAPTAFNFVSSDYNRKTGLVGNQSSKYLNSNRAGNADPQDNCHLAVYNTFVHNPATSIPSGSGGAMIGNGSATAPGSLHIGVFGGAEPNRTFIRNRSATLDLNIGVARDLILFQGVSRSNASSYVVRVSGESFTISRNSELSIAGNHFVFARNNAGTPETFANSRMTFYSIGESLNLAQLEARVTALMTAIGDAIP